MNPVNVVCIRWGNKYGADYVNRLYAMVARHLHRPFRFVCLSDERSGIDPVIEVLPIPQTGVPDLDQRTPWTLQHGWLKLALFAAPLHDLSGPTLFLDLDLVIVDRIDEFFLGAGAFKVIREWDKRDGTGNTSVFRFEAGQHAELLARFGAGPATALKQVRNEQEYVSQHFRERGLIEYWPPEWCVSFKRHCLPTPLWSWLVPAHIPADARIVIFHGKPNPPDAIAGIGGKWYRRIRRSAWVAEHWR